MFPSAKDYLADSQAANAYCERRAENAAQLAQELHRHTVEWYNSRREADKLSIILYGHAIVREIGSNTWMLRPRGSEQFVNCSYNQLRAFILAKNW